MSDADDREPPRPGLPYCLKFFAICFAMGWALGLFITIPETDSIARAAFDALLFGPILAVPVVVGDYVQTVMKRRASRRGKH